MRLALLLLSLFAFAACSIGNGEQVGTAPENDPDFGPHDCVSQWLSMPPMPGPELLSPTIEERVAGTVGVARVILDSVSYELPRRAWNNRVDLGIVKLGFTVLENLKTGYRPPDNVWPYMEVGYHCEYIEDDDRDREALAELSAGLERFFAGKMLIVFLPDYGGFSMNGRISFHENRNWSPDALVDRYGLWSNWNDGSQWLMEAEGLGTEENPYFIDPLDALYTVSVPVNTISLLEIREKVEAVIAEEEERGVECVGASYKHQWYVRSGEENWYSGLLSEDGTPIECFAAIP